MPKFLDVPEWYGEDGTLFTLWSKKGSGFLMGSAESPYWNQPKLLLLHSGECDFVNGQTTDATSGEATACTLGFFSPTANLTTIDSDGYVDGQFAVVTPGGATLINYPSFTGSMYYYQLFIM